MSIGNITRGQTSYSRRGCIWLLAISYLLNHMMMRLLGKTHFNYFRICSFYFSHLSHGFFELYQVLLSSYYRIYESHSRAWIRYLGSCYILYGHIWLILFTAHLWEDYHVLIPRCFVYLWYTQLVYCLFIVWTAMYCNYHITAWPTGVCIAGWRCTRFFWFNRIPKNCFFRLKKESITSLCLYGIY